MMYRYASAFVLLISGTAMAQVSLSVGNHVPVVGQTVALRTAATYTSNGPVGAGVTYNHWDLFPASTGNRNFYYAAATSTMPGASLASTDGGSDTTFWSLTSNGLTVVGLRGSLEGVLTYTDPVVELKLPLSYGQSWTDVGTASFTVSGIPVTRIISLAGAADAYGTLNLPGAAGQSVLRVKVRRQTNDNSAFLSLNRISNITYFYTAANAHPMLKLVEDSISSGTGAWNVTRALEYVGDATSVGLQEIGPDDVSFTAFPNPASNSVNVQLDGPVDVIQLIDSKGALVRSVNTTSDRVLLDLNGVGAGHYLVRAYLRGAAVETRALVVE